MDKKRSIAVLFLGSIERTEEYPASERPIDEIDFGKPVRVTLIRIPKAKRQLYGRHTSVTQPEPIKGFEIYFRNLEETGGRYSLLTTTNDLMITSTQDVLITPAKPFTTDLLVLRGCFMKLSLCVYGQVVDPQSVSLWTREAAVGEPAMAMEIKRNIFEEKRSCVRQIESQLRAAGENVNLSTADSWEEGTNDDEINEPQIKNICNISDHLLNTFQQINEDQYVVKFRENIENINNHLQKLFKAKLIGLYYHRSQNYAVQNDIPLPLVHIALASLKLTLSDQFRVLETLKMLGQLPRHAHALIDSGGVAQLSSLFVDLYRPQAVYFSTFKNLLLEVCIALAQWPTAAQRMVTKMEEDFFDEIYQTFPPKDKEPEEKKENAKQKQKEKEKQRQKSREKEKSKGKSRSRSRDRIREKRSKSSDSESDGDDSKRKRKKDKKDKDKGKKKDKSKKKEKQKDKDKQKFGDDRKDKQKKKSKEEKKSKQQKAKAKQEKSKNKEEREASRKEESASPIKAESSGGSEEAPSKLSFYQFLFFTLLQERNSKTITLVKILIEQITQTLTKGREISEQVALVTSFLRDTKYLFNPSTEIINSKSLKVFATFQPFLNDNQSEDVDCRYISEHEKLKNPLKHGINPKTFRVLTRINQEMVDGARRQTLGIGSPFDERFMLMMSELLFEKERPILGGFTRIVNAFKAEGLMQLQRKEAAISILAEYIYKALLEDEGVSTFIYIEHIHASLIKFIGLLNEDPSLFSTELKSRIKLLSNYATPYDHFNRNDGAFKSFCEYFLRLFKYDNYEIEINNKAKLTEFRKKQYERLINPFTFENLNDNYSLKNFNDVSSSQPLLEIDVSLKIFLLLSDYNKNIWTAFYENKLISGFASLLNKLSNLILFFLQQTPNRWTAYASTKSYLPTFDNYLTVAKHVLAIIAKKCRYEAAYNDLLEEDIFEDVQLHEKVIELYLAIYSALNDPKLMIYWPKSRAKARSVLTLVVEILDQLLTSYELVSHQTRELKLKRLLQYLYLTHYSSIRCRAGVLSLYGQLAKHAEGSTCKYLVLHLLDGHFTLSKLLEHDVAYIPANDRPMLENIIRSNLYRADLLVTGNLALLIKSLFAKPQYVDKALDMLERLFDDIDEEYKKNEEESGQLGWKNLRKAHLFTEVLQRSETALKGRLDDKLMRFFRRLCEYFRKRRECQPESEAQQQDFLVFLKIRNNFMTYFSRLLRENQESPSILLQFFDYTSRALSLQYFSFAPASQFAREVNSEVLQACRNYVQGLCEVGFVGSYQCLLLYGEILQKPYKMQTFIAFNDLFASLERLLLSGLYVQTSPEMREIARIVSSIFYFLCQLTTINEEELFTTQSRRQAIVCLITPSEKDFPFAALRQSPLYSLIPREFIRLLEEYFSYPIVEKPIILRARADPKPPVKTKSTIYSKSVFSIISEHDPVSKTRFKYIGGEWVGGDADKGLYSPFRSRNYEEEVDRYLAPRQPADYQKYHIKEYSLDKQPLYFNDLFYLAARKDRQEAPKKEIDRTINLKDVLPRLTPQEIKKEVPKPSPSPSKLTNPANNLSSPPPSNIPQPSPSPLNKQSSMSNDRNYNKGGQRSGSQGSNQGNYSHGGSYYSGGSGSRQQNPPMGGMGGMGSHYPPASMHGYPPQQQQGGYPPYYNTPQGMYPPQGPPPRYPPGPYQPMGQQYPPAMQKPMYGQPVGGSMYPPMPPQLNQFEEQMFQEAYQLVNELKNSNSLNEHEISTKKGRLNYILSSHPKVHTKLKDSLFQQPQ